MTCMDFCRICLCEPDEDNSIALAKRLRSSVAEEQITFLDAYKECTRLEARSSDKLCTVCGEQLKICYKFIQKAKESDTILKLHVREIVLPDAVEDEVPEPDSEIQTNLDPLCCEDAENSGISSPASNTNDTKDMDEEQKEIVDSFVELVQIEENSHHIVEEDSYQIIEENFHYQREENNESSDSDLYTKIDGSYSDDEVCSTNMREDHVSDDQPRDTSTDQKFKCKICGKAYKFLKSFQYHMAASHGPNHKCSLCEKEFVVEQSLKLHMLNHKGKSRFLCDFCPKEYEREKLLIMHLKKNHPDVSIETIQNVNEETSQNTAAIQSYNDKDDTQDSKAIKTNKGNNVTGHDVSSSRLTTSLQQTYFCGTCPETFRTMDELREHSSTHKGDRPFECESCDAKFARWADLEDHKLMHTNENPFECSICNKIVSSQKSLKNHMKYHNPKPLSCPACDKKYVQQYQLSRHVLSHTGEKPFPCQFCEWGFLRKVTLDEHIKQQHELHNSDKEESESLVKADAPYEMFSLATIDTNVIDEDVEVSDLIIECEDEELEDLSETQNAEPKPKNEFICGKCGKDFETSDRLRRHKYDLCGEKNYLCTMCPKRFSIKARLINHTRTHTGERPFACRCCDKRFTNRNALDSHIRVHTGERPYQCKMCDKRFAQHSTMMAHMRAIHMPKTFACYGCVKKFSSQIELTRHIRVHTGERPYACKFCTKSYTKLYGLKDHMKRFHKEKLGK